MNSLYIGVGVAIILALVTALLGPFFVDWGTHRAVFEAEASRIVGLPVRVLGDVDARLLPSPRVRFGDVVVGDLAHPVARVGRFDLDLDVAGLIRGETRVSELVLDRPSIDLTIESDGRLIGLPEQGADLAHVPIEAIRFVDGRARLIDRRSEAEWTATKLSGAGSVESLGGSWRVDVSGVSQGRALNLRLAARGSGETRLLRTVLALPEVGLTLSGDLAATATGGRASLTGPVTVARTGETAGPITATAAMTLDPDGLRLDGLAVVVGDEVEGARFEGTARAVFAGATTLDVDLAAKRLDFDGTAPAPGGARARLAALGVSVQGVADRLALPRATRLGLSLGSVAVGGGLVSDVALEARTRAGGWTIDRLAARLPGDTRLDLGGRLALADGVALDGRGAIEIGGPEMLAAWWSGEPAGEARIGDLKLDGGFTLSKDGFFGPDLAVTLAGAQARGRVEKRADGAVRLGLSADRLDGARVLRLARRLGVSTATGRGFDLDLDVREVDLGSSRAKGARLALRLAEDAVTIDRLAIADLAGARVEGAGRITSLWTAPSGGLDLRLSAERPGPAAKALAGLASPEAAALAETIGTAAGPLDLTLNLTGGSARGGDALRLVVGGRAAGGDLTIDGTWTGRLDDLTHGRIEAKADLAGARVTPAVARWLEVKPGEASVLAGSISGRASEGITFAFKAGLGGRGAEITGRLLRPDEGTPNASFQARLAAPDVGLLAGLAGRPGLAFERRLPVDLRLTAQGWGDDWQVSDLSGSVAETQVAASGALVLSGPRPKATGRLRLDRADIAVLADAALSIGVDFDLATTIDRLDDDEDPVATAVTARVLGEPGAARMLDLAATIGKATIGGEIRERRTDATTTVVSGRLEARGFPWATVRDAGRPSLGGTMSGEVVFEANGEDRVGLAKTMTGSGRLRLDDGHLRGVALDGLKAPSGAAEITADRLVQGMAAHETVLPPIELPLLIDKGSVQIPRFRVAVVGGLLSGRATIDPVAGTLDGTVSVEPSGEGATRRASAVSHAMPSLDLVLSGAIAAPHLASETTSLAAFLSLHRLEREIEAAEASRQDRIERLRFSTILKRIEERRRARDAEAAKAAMPVIEAPKAPTPQVTTPAPAPAPATPREPSAPVASPPVTAPSPAIILAPSPPAIGAAPSSLAPMRLSPVTVAPVEATDPASRPSGGGGAPAEAAGIR